MISFFFSGEGASVRWEIELPTDTRVTVRTSGGGISLTQMRAPAKLHTSGGAIDVKDLASDLQAQTSGGSIRLERIRDRARVETSGGEIDAERPKSDRRHLPCAEVVSSPLES